MPTDVLHAAREGLALRRALRYAGSGTGQRMAERLLSEKPMTASTMRRLATYFDTHELPPLVGSTGRPHRMHVAWLLRGGDAGRVWAQRMVAALDAAGVGAGSEVQEAAAPTPQVQQAC